MANTHTAHDNGANVSVDGATLWAETAAKAKYAVHNNLPLIGVSPESGDGFILSLSMPQGFEQVPEAMRAITFRAFASLAKDTAQAAIKGKDNGTRANAEAAVSAVMAGTYSPKREVSADVVENEAATRFETLIRERLAAAGYANATEKQVADTVTKQAGTEAGKKFIADFKLAVIADATYSPSRKGKGTAGALDLSL